MWFVTIILLGVAVILALWGLDEKGRLEKLEAEQQKRK